MVFQFQAVNITSNHLFNQPLPGNIKDPPGKQEKQKGCSCTNQINIQIVHFSCIAPLRG